MNSDSRLAFLLRALSVTALGIAGGVLGHAYAAGIPARDAAAWATGAFLLAGAVVVLAAAALIVGDIALTAGRRRRPRWE
jgi:hypothetical protein